MFTAPGTSALEKIDAGLSLPSFASIASGVPLLDDGDFFVA
jgi:hypothetical protein